MREKIFDNMESAAKRYLAVSLAAPGFYSLDGKHCLGRGLAEACPDTLSGGVFRLAGRIPD